MRQKRVTLHGISTIKIMAKTENIRTLAVAAVTNKYFEIYRLNKKVSSKLDTFDIL